MISPATSHSDLVRIARWAGIWYLLLALSGMTGFLFIHPKLFVPDDPAATLTNLSQNEMLARTRVLLEFVIICSQALAAVWFYRLFKDVNDWAAWALGIWGTVNSVIILVSAVAMASSINIAGATNINADDQVALIQLLQQLATNAWGTGSLFFGLWLIPMGYIVTTSKRMPVWLGRTLIIGGIGYLLSAFLSYGGVSHPLVGALPIPATIGEFWMVGYLLIFGIRPSEPNRPTV